MASTAAGGSSDSCGRGNGKPRLVVNAESALEEASHRDAICAGTLVRGTPATIQSEVTLGTYKSITTIGGGQQ